jgi:hypothetical protein
VVKEEPEFTGSRFPEKNISLTANLKTGLKEGIFTLY